MVLEKLRNIPCIIALLANKIKHYNIFQIDKAFTIFCLRKTSIIFSFHYWVWHITGAFSENVNKQRDTEFPKNKIKLWNFKMPPRKIPKSRKNPSENSEETSAILERLKKHLRSNEDSDDDVGVDLDEEVLLLWRSLHQIILTYFSLFKKIMLKCKRSSMMVILHFHPWSEPFWHRPNRPPVFTLNLKSFSDKKCTEFRKHYDEHCDQGFTEFGANPFIKFWPRWQRFWWWSWPKCRPKTSGKSSEVLA